MKTESGRRLGPQDGKMLAMLWQQLTVASKIEAAVGSAKTSVNGVMVTTTVKSGSGQNLVELPDEISVNVPLFVNRPVRQFHLVVTVLADSHGDIMIVAEAPEIEVLMFQEISEMGCEVRDGLSDLVPVAVGQLTTGQWRYN